MGSGRFWGVKVLLWGLGGFCGFSEFMVQGGFCGFGEFMGLGGFYGAGWLLRGWGASGCW